MKAIRYIPVLILIFICFQLKAQDKVIQGIVTAFDSIPLIGAEVKVKSTKQVVRTDTLGKFAVACNPDDKLKISAEGFVTDNVKLNAGAKLVAANLKLKPGDKNRKYAMGYTSITDKERFNTMASINKNDMDFSKYNNIYEVISGRFPGVQVMKGGAIVIRGVGSFSLSSSALIVLNGIQYTNSSILNTIHPSQLESINVLKGPKASMYGAQGSNGVIVIETKKGN